MTSEATRELLKRRYLRLISTRRDPSKPIPRNLRPSKLRGVVLKRRRESTLWARKLTRVAAEAAPGQWVKVKTYRERGTARQTVCNLRRGARYQGGAKVPVLPGVRFEFTAVGWQVWARHLPEGGARV